MRLIPEFDGTGIMTIAQWLKRLDLVSQVHGGYDIATVIPLRLAGDAWSVYERIPERDRGNEERVRQALLAAFGVDKHEAYEQFVCRKLQRGESPDVYLSALERLAAAFGGISETAMICAFIAGLPNEVRATLRGNTRMENQGLTEVIITTRAVMAQTGTLN